MWGMSFVLLVIQLLVRFAVHARLHRSFDGDAFVTEMATDPLMWLWGVAFAVGLWNLFMIIEYTGPNMPFVKCPHCGIVKKAESDLLHQPIGAMIHCNTCGNNAIKATTP